MTASSATQTSAPARRAMARSVRSPGRSALLPDRFNECLDRRQHAFDHDGDTFPIGVDAVIEIESSFAGHAVEEERVEHYAVRFGEIGIDRVEGLRVFRPEVAPGHHPGEEDRNVALLQAGYGGI